MTTPRLSAAALALDYLADAAALADQDRHAVHTARLSLVGHYTRAEGMTAADVPLTMPHRATAIGALSSELTPLARAALDYATDRPDLALLLPAAGVDLARRYLP